MSIGAGFAPVTDARPGTSVGTNQRVRRYAVTMAFRTGCFVAAATFAHGWLQWVLMGGAVFLPYLAVLAANQVDARGSAPRARAADGDHRQLTSGPEPEYVEGEVL